MTNVILAAGKSSSSSGEGMIFFVLFSVFAGLVVAANIYVLRRRRQKYQSLITAIEADPTDWVRIMTGRAVPRRPTGPLLFHCGSATNKNEEHVVAMDEQHLVVRCLRSGRVVELEPWGTVPRYHDGFFVKYLDVCGERIYQGPLPAVCGALDRLGWTVLDSPSHSSHFYGIASEGNWPKPAPAATPAHVRIQPSRSQQPPGPQAAWTPRPHGHVPGSPTWTSAAAAGGSPAVRNPANTPVVPAFSTPDRGSTTPKPARRAAEEIEFGTDQLGPAIDDWIDGDDLDEIE